MRFRLLWGFDALIAVVFLYFFFVGLADGSVSSFNIRLWLITLLGLAAILGGGLYFRAAGRSGLATAILLVLAIPGVLYALFLLFILIAAPRWN